MSSDGRDFEISQRQVGFDLLGRPVIYSCFVQATAVPTVEDTVSHCTYLIENAQKVMENGVSTWVFILDCRGMSLPACNPKIGYGLTQVFANFYPERLGLVICLHHNPIFHGVWNGIKVFLHENTVAKMHLLRAKKKIVEEFNRLFNPELRDWLFEEMRFNKMKPLPLSQRTFWKAPSNPKDHDPRGCSSYVSEYINKYLKNVNKDPESTHRPHPNIVDELKGICKPLRTDLAKLEDDGPSTASNHGQIDEDSESEESTCLHRLESIEISSEYQIPEDAVRLQS